MPHTCTRVGLLFPLRDCPEALQEAVKRWSGGGGLATCQVITILDMRQPYAHGIPLAERLEDRAVWPAEQDGAPLIERARSYPVDTCSRGDHMGRTYRASGRVMHDGATASRDADRDAAPQSIECCRQA